jgi:hypothetical protein
MDCTEFLEDFKLKFAGRYKAPTSGQLAGKANGSQDKLRKYDNNPNNQKNNKTGWHGDIRDESEQAEEDARIERERLAKLEAERLAELERQRLAKLEAERLERERLAKLEAERLERERMAKLEAERLERERLAKLEAERLERARLAKLEADRKAEIRRQLYVQMSDALRELKNAEKNRARAYDAWISSKSGSDAYSRYIESMKAETAAGHVYNSLKWRYDH